MVFQKGTLLSVLYGNFYWRHASSALNARLATAAQARAVDKRGARTPSSWLARRVYPQESVRAWSPIWIFGPM
jgi:hypothetical protein